jgi:hypothetical protein
VNIGENAMRHLLNAIIVIGGIRRDNRLAGGSASGTLVTPEVEASDDPKIPGFAYTSRMARLTLITSDEMPASPDVNWFESNLRKNSKTFTLAISNRRD